MSDKAMGAGFLLGSSRGFFGGTICSVDDDSFYCKLDRFTNEIRMILFLILLVTLPIYYLKAYFSKKK